jgi:hypothetical protein
MKITKEQRQTILNEMIMDSMMKLKSEIIELEQQEQPLIDLSCEMEMKYGRRNKLTSESIRNSNGIQHSIRNKKLELSELFIQYNHTKK